jgi:hypothetical protein
MVRAILEGRKTQTRRVIKPQAETYCTKCKEDISICSCTFGECENGEDAVTEAEKCTRTKKHIPENCPYGIPGDRLWVRETFYSDVTQSEYEDAFGGSGVFYKATEISPDIFYWKPSIHMPRWASRILLEVTNVRVQRVQDITYEAIKSEGWKKAGHIDNDEVHRDAAKDWWMDTWNSINEAKGFGWEANPRVWVVEFKRLTP